MTIQEAIESGKKFRRPCWGNDWGTPTSAWKFSIEAVLATDWEVLLCEKHASIIGDIETLSYVQSLPVSCNFCSQAEIELKVGDRVTFKNSHRCYIGKEEGDYFTLKQVEHEYGDTFFSMISEKTSNVKYGFAKNLVLAPGKLIECINYDALIWDMADDEDKPEAQEETGCICGAEVTYGEDATHAPYCPKVKVRK